MTTPVWWLPGTFNQLYQPIIIDLTSFTGRLQSAKNHETRCKKDRSSSNHHTRGAMRSETCTESIPTAMPPMMSLTQ